MCLYAEPPTIFAACFCNPAQASAESTIIFGGVEIVDVIRSFALSSNEGRHQTIARPLEEIASWDER